MSTMWSIEKNTVRWFWTALRPYQPASQWGRLRMGQRHQAWKWPIPPSSTKLNNECASTSTPKYVFVARCLIMHKVNFSLLVLWYLQILFHVLQQGANGGWRKMHNDKPHNFRTKFCNKYSIRPIIYYIQARMGRQHQNNCYGKSLQRQRLKFIGSII